MGRLFGAVAANFCCSCFERKLPKRPRVSVGSLVHKTPNACGRFGRHCLETHRRGLPAPVGTPSALCTKPRSRPPHTTGSPHAPDRVEGLRLGPTGSPNRSGSLRRRACPRLSPREGAGVLPDGLPGMDGSHFRALYPIISLSNFECAQYGIRYNGLCRTCAPPMHGGYRRQYTSQLYRCWR